MHPGGQARALREHRRKLVEPVTCSLWPPRLEHERRGAAERLAGGLCERVERLRQAIVSSRAPRRSGRSRAEPAPAARARRSSPRCGGRARRGAQRCRGARGPSRQNGRASRVQHAEHAPDLAQPRDRRVHDLREDLVVLGRSREARSARSRASGRADQRRAPAGRSPAGGPRGRCSLGHPEDGRAADIVLREGSKTQQSAASAPSSWTTSVTRRWMTDEKRRSEVST